MLPTIKPEKIIPGENDGVSARRFLLKEDLVELFERKDIPYQTWGSGTSDSLEKLLTTLTRCQVTLDQSAATPLLTVDNAVVIVKYLGLLHWWELVETKQVFHNGQVRTRNFNGISETMHETENIDAEGMEKAARRALVEELDQDKNGFENPRNYELIKWDEGVIGPQESEKWPGLDAVFRRHIYLCLIRRKLFRRKGYCEVQGDKTTYFEWKQIV